MCITEHLSVDLNHLKCNFEVCNFFICIAIVNCIIKSMTLTASEADETVLYLQATFDPEIFFNIILPPIIFNAGYQMKRVC